MYKNSTLTCVYCEQMKLKNLEVTEKKQGNWKGTQQESWS